MHWHHAVKDLTIFLFPHLNPILSHIQFITLKNFNLKEFQGVFNSFIQIQMLFKEQFKG